jgi:hypothetical protein
MEEVPTRARLCIKMDVMALVIVARAYRSMQIWRIESRNHPLTVNMETTPICSRIFATFEPRNTLHGSFSLQYLTTSTAILYRGLGLYGNF